MANGQKAEGLMYKGHPLRRVGNMIYYGSMADPYIILMQVRESKKVQDLDVATKVSLELQRTAPNLKPRDRIVKKSEKDSLYSALDFGGVWLERALSGKYANSRYEGLSGRKQKKATEFVQKRSKKCRREFTRSRVRFL